MIDTQQSRSVFSRLNMFVRSHRVASMIVGQVVVLAVLVTFVLNGVVGISLFSASAEISCPSGDNVYTIQSGDTLGRIAAANGTSWQTLAQHNQMGNPNLIYANQQICIPGNAPAPQPVSSSIPLHNSVNPFAYGQCTWWASQRYHDISGYYVPWTSNADAWQWTARAYDYGWHVSDQPSVGAIIDFQGGVQYASDWGHVGVVEQILPNGDIVASNMNVYGHPFGTVVNLTYHTGPGVTFITA
jgi:N-acetylmuramoyl-L-alanine amidase